MRRTKIILAVAALLVAMLAASAGPAMAASDNDTRQDRQDINLDRQLLNENNDRFFFDDGFRDDGVFFTSDFFPFFDEDDFFNDGMDNVIFQSVG